MSSWHSDGQLMERQYTAGQRSWWLRLGGFAHLGSAADGERKSGRAGGSGASRERVFRSKRAGVASASLGAWGGRGAQPYFERPVLGCFCELEHAV